VLVTLGGRHFGTNRKMDNKNGRFSCWGGRKDTNLGHEEEKKSENVCMSVVGPTLERLEKWSCGHLVL